VFNCADQLCHFLATVRCLAVLTAADCMQLSNQLVSLLLKYCTYSTYTTQFNGHFQVHLYYLAVTKVSKESMKTDAAVFTRTSSWRPTSNVKAPTAL